MIRTAACAAWLLLVVSSTPAPAQTIEVGSFYSPTALDGVWKHIIGDDPRFSEPGFDDSAWNDIPMPGTGPQFTRGSNWFRFRVRLPHPLPGEPIGVLIAPFCYAYDIYVNGYLSGTFGDPRRSAFGQAAPVPAVFEVPANSQSLTIAIRCVNQAAAVGFGADFQERSWIGTLADVRVQLELERARRRGRIPLWVTLTMLITLAILFLITPLWRSDSPEFFWCGLTLILIASNRVLMGFPELLDPNPARATASTLIAGSYLLSMRRMFSILFERDLHLPVRVIFYSTVVASFLLACLYQVSYEALSAYAVPLGVAVALTMALVYWDFARSGSSIREAPIMHLGIGLYLATLFLYYGSVLVRRSGITDMGPLFGVVLRYPQEMATIGLMAFPAAMVILLNRRSGRVLLERQRLRQEIATAAEMQALLVPARATEVPGFRVETEYWPASEVGGDFYWTRREPDGSLLIVLGDVSGKGLRAAMLVSVAIGVLRNEKSSSPAVILAHLNDAFTGNTGGGFITCLAARLQPNGHVIMANAGHVTPYCEGQEATVDSALPLGIIAGAEYAESMVTANYLVFVSDGVIEATNDDGELFGFERTRQMGLKSALEIAAAARAWGQNDDITVVTVRRDPE